MTDTPTPKPRPVVDLARDLAEQIDDVIRAAGRNPGRIASTARPLPALFTELLEALPSGTPEYLRVTNTRALTDAALVFGGDFADLVGEVLIQARSVIERTFKVRAS